MLLLAVRVVPIAGDLLGLSELAVLDRQALLLTNSHGELPTHRPANAEVMEWLVATGTGRLLAGYCYSYMWNLLATQ